MYLKNMWVFQYRVLCKTAAPITLRHHLHINAALFARTGTKKKPRPIPHEPGMKHWTKMLQEDTKLHEEHYHEFQNECDLNDDLDLMHPEKAFDLHVEENKKLRKKLQQKIIMAKFFSPRSQPLMLTWNERNCIKYLHKEDPVQWDIKTLSENFPATPDTIRKILKSKAKITPERAKLMDSKAQKNWELLAEGKLDADPHVLEHLKKFVNRREVLLEQINNMKFYLPEIKKEPVWNQGEMSNIIVKYEKALERLIEESEQCQNFKTFSDRTSEEKSINKEKKSSLDLLHKKIEDQSGKETELKDSFFLKEMVTTFSKHKTFEELENELLQRAEKREKLELTEKAILEANLGVKSLDNSNNIDKSGSTNIIKKNELIIQNKFQEKTEKSCKIKKIPNLETDVEYKVDNTKSKVKKSDEFINSTSNLHHNKTYFFDENGIAKFLNKIETKSEPEKSSTKEAVVKEKSKIDHSHPESLKKENEYYDKEVSHIEGTAFWNSRKSSKEKAMAEYEKRPLEEPINSDNMTIITKSAVLSTDVYPERIKIPKNKRGSGLTFKVKDCYYDDNGEFLYRVPGMSK